MSTPTIRPHALVCLIVAFAALTMAAMANASYAIYVGRHLTEDGSVLLGGSGDEVSSHWLEIVPAATHPAGATIRVGVDDTALMPGEFMDIPQVSETARYISMNYSEYEGFPPPLTNGGLNQHGVAARDVWVESRPELIAMTPSPQRGPNYSDLSRMVMERARSAEDAVRLVGELIDRHGYSTYGGNSHLFADHREGWVLIEYPGGQGLWVARRLGPDEIVMLYPGYIGQVPLDFREHPDYRGSDHFIDFAVQQGWFDPESGQPFDADTIYGAGYVRSPRDELPMELRAAAPVSLREMMDAVRDVRISKDATGYGQVAQLREEAIDDLRLLWVAPTGSVTAPFLPWRIGVEGVPPEFGKHRYLTKGEDRRYVTRDWQMQEATEFAGRLFKRLMYFTCEHPARFLPETTAALTAFEDRMIAEQAWLEDTARLLYREGRSDLARTLLTRYSHGQAREALSIGAALLGGIETRTRLLYGIRAPAGDDMSRLDYQMVTCQETPERPAD